MPATPAPEISASPLMCPPVLYVPRPGEILSEGVDTFAHMVSMRFSLLGTVEVSADGHVLGGAPRHRAMLAYLLLNAGSTVSTDRLIEAMWGPTPPETAKAQVQASVMAIRRMLRAAQAENVVQTRPAGYAVVTEPGQVDVHEFRRLAAGDREEIRQALGLWRGQALADVQADFVPATRALLEEQRLTALERLAELELEAGRYAVLLDELAAEVAGHPLRERLRGQYVLALHRSGRQAEALAAARDYRTTLAAQQGLDPSREFAAVEEAVLRDDRPAVVNFLPYDVPDFAGRDAELERLAQLPDGVSVVAIDGMAGIGKTTLAVHAGHLLAERFPDGALFVDLQAHTAGRDPVDPGDALEILLRQLGVPAERVPPGTSERAALWRAELSGLRALVVIDNAADAQHVRPLLPGGSGSMAVITSRRRLTDLDGAHAISVDVLSERDAVELFTGVVGPRARAEPAAVAEVLSLCGFLPLAVRIAAARLRHRPRWTVDYLAVRLRDQGRRLAELATAERGVAAAFGLSYEQLSADHRRMFRLLGLHPGQDIDAYAAAALAGLTVTRAESLLEDLLDTHMLLQQEPGRYTFHDLLRDHARSAAVLEEQDASAKAALTRLFAFYTHLTGMAADLRYADRVLPAPHEPAPGLETPPLSDRADAAAWLDTELPALLAVGAHAAEHGWHTQAFFLSTTLFPFLEERGRRGAALTLHLQTLSAVRQAADLWSEGRTLADLARTHHALGNVAQAVQYAHEAISTCRAAGDPEGEAVGHHFLGHSLERRGDVHGAHDHYRQALELFQKADNRVGTGVLLIDMGETYRQLGKPDLARDYLTQAQRINHEIGSQASLWNAQLALGNLHTDQSEHDAARRAFERAYAISRDLGPHLQAETLNALGAAARAMGDHHQALIDHDAALALATEIDDPHEAAHGHLGLAKARHALGHTALTRTHAQEAVRLLEELDNPAADTARALL
ncbi:BTAD domain-containing putative transcriptional regulator [Nonomuraea sp. NPDC023979]|uniref:AfsR/SARP family transcriptional regulator n=1 Tax=Nonomuraea sp. NPDC023979 TaxID=3154796 RepID=UPI0033C79187